MGILLVSYDMFFKILSSIFLLCPLFVFAEPSPMPKLNSARLLLSKVRGGDYAHAGDKQATEMVLERLLQIAREVRGGKALDIGSGFGGTADDIYHFGFHDIYGIDIDKAAIAYSQARYPHITFIQADAKEIATVFSPNLFSLVSLFNVCYAIENKQALLEQTYAVTRPGGILVLFDYTSKEGTLPLKDFAGKEMHPMVLSSLQKQLASSSWNILEMTDLSHEYIEWYEQFLDKLSAEHAVLSKEFSEEDIMRVTAMFATMLEWLKGGSLGGAVIYAQKPK